MAEQFDPLYEWLGITPKDQPPNFYRLLGIETFEQNAKVIESAADRQMAHVRTFQSGKHAAESQHLLNRLATARVCLLNASEKAIYDEDLRKTVDGPGLLATPSDGFSALLIALAVGGGTIVLLAALVVAWLVTTADVSPPAAPPKAKIASNGNSRRLPEATARSDSSLPSATRSDASTDAVTSSTPLVSVAQIPKVREVWRRADSDDSYRKDGTRWLYTEDGETTVFRESTRSSKYVELQGSGGADNRRLFSKYVMQADLEIGQWRMMYRGGWGDNRKPPPDEIAETAPTPSTTAGIGQEAPKSPPQETIGDWVPPKAPTAEMSQQPLTSKLPSKNTIGGRNAARSSINATGQAVVSEQAAVVDQSDVATDLKQNDAARSTASPGFTLDWLDHVEVGELRAMAEHTDPILDLDITADGAMLVSGGEDGVLRTWDLATGSEIQQFAAKSGYIYAAAIAPDGRFVVANLNSSMLGIWNTKTGALQGQIPTHYRVVDIAFSPEGRRLAWGLQYDGTSRANIGLWNMFGNRPLGQLRTDGYPRAIKFSPDGRRVATGTKAGVHIFDSIRKRQVLALAGHAATVDDLAFSPDGDLLASVGEREVILWDLDLGEEIRRFTTSSATPCVAFAPDGRFIATPGGNEGEVSLWEVATGRLSETLTPKGDAVSARYAQKLVYLPDPRGLVSAHCDGSIRLWRLPD